MNTLNKILKSTSNKLFPSSITNAAGSGARLISGKICALIAGISLWLPISAHTLSYKSIVQLPGNRRASFETEIGSMVAKGYISQPIGDSIAKAIRFRSPFTFYTKIEGYVQQGHLSPKTAFFVMRAYDKAKGLNTSVTDWIAHHLRPRNMQDTAGYNAYQTYRIVRDDAAIFQTMLEQMFPNNEKRIGNLLAYRSARQLSNGPFAQATETLRKSTYKIEPAKIDPLPVPREITSIEVRGTSTFVTAQWLVDLGYNPAVLNMANETEPGGGFITGASAQEEQLCRQSNLYEGLEFARNKKLYPIGPFEVIVAPQTTFFRDDQYQSVSPFQVDVIGSAAYICAGSQKNRPVSDEQYQKNTKEKMRSMFRAAINQKNDALLLSAFGCGAFRNDPKCISQWYKEVLQEEEFQGRFRKVVFGIIDDHNGTNLQPFRNTFQS